MILQICMYSLIFIKTILLVFDFNQSSLKNINFVYIILSTLNYFIAEKIQFRIDFFLQRNINNNVLKLYYKILFFLFFLLQYMSFIMFSLDKIWVMNIIYIFFYNIIIYCHINILNVKFMPYFYKEFSISLLNKSISFFSVCGFIFCLTLNNQRLDKLSPIIASLFFIIFFFIFNVVNTKIKNFNVNRPFYLYSKYQNIIKIEILYIIFTCLLEIMINNDKNYENLINENQNTYEFFAIFCSRLNIISAFFGLTSSIKDTITISKIQINKQVNLKKIAIIIEPSFQNEFDIRIGFPQS